MSELTNQEEREPTPQELNEYRESMKKFYDQQIPMLKKQREYETLLADIEEARAKRITMNIRIAQMMAGPPEAPSKEEQEEMMKAMKEEMQKETPAEESFEKPRVRKLKKED